MTPENDLELQLTALLLGELPPHESARLHAAIDNDAELAELYKNLKGTIHLVREVTATPETPAEPMRLSEDRREKLLTHFKTVRPREFEKPAAPSRRWVLLMGVAAGAVAVIGILVLSPDGKMSFNRKSALASESASASDLVVVSPIPIKAYNGVGNRPEEARLAQMPAQPEPLTAANAAEPRPFIELKGGRAILAGEPAPVANTEMMVPVTNPKDGTTRSETHSVNVVGFVNLSTTNSLQVVANSLDSDSLTAGKPAQLSGNPGRVLAGEPAPVAKTEIVLPVATQPEGIPSNVYSLDVVGFVNLNLTNGLQIAANQLDSGSLIAGKPAQVANESLAWKFDAGGRGYSSDADSNLPAQLAAGNLDVSKTAALASHAAAALTATPPTINPATGVPVTTSTYTPANSNGPIDGATANLIDPNTGLPVNTLADFGLASNARSGGAPAKPGDSALDSSIDVLRKRVDKQGVEEPQLREQNRSFGINGQLDSLASFAHAAPAPAATPPTATDNNFYYRVQPPDATLKIAGAGQPDQKESGLNRSLGRAEAPAAAPFVAQGIASGGVSVTAILPGADEFKNIRELESLAEKKTKADSRKGFPTVDERPTLRQPVAISGAPEGGVATRGGGFGGGGGIGGGGLGGVAAIRAPSGTAANVNNPNNAQNRTTAFNADTAGAPVVIPENGAFGQQPEGNKSAPLRALREDLFRADKSIVADASQPATPPPAPGGLPALGVAEKNQDLGLALRVPQPALQTPPVASAAPALGDIPAAGRLFQPAKVPPPAAQETPLSSIPVIEPPMIDIQSKFVETPGTPPSSAAAATPQTSPVTPSDKELTGSLTRRFNVRDGEARKDMVERELAKGAESRSKKSAPERVPESLAEAKAPAPAAGGDKAAKDRQSGRRAQLHAADLDKIVTASGVNSSGAGNLSGVQGGINFPITTPVAAATPPVQTQDLPAAAPHVPAVPAQPEILTIVNKFSTFSMNVSDVSFALAAATLEKGQMPDAGGIRSEEFINAFDYRDPEPAPDAPIGFAWERVHSPFVQNRDLVRFSVRTAAAGRIPGRPLNLVLLLDNSGSMERADRVRIIHEALHVLAGQLQPQDTLSVVLFSRTARLWVDGVSGDQANAVVEQVSSLTPDGGTNLEEAMNLAYETALRHYLPKGANRVVLLTDGAANLGNVQPDALKQKAEANRKQGISLDAFGIGWEGFNDDLLEVLTRTGGGRYRFINTPGEAATDFAGQLAGALHVAAEDVKVQVEFNPARATAYRQIGYAHHQLKKEEFRDNSVKAAQIGAAESGNALYVMAINPNGTGPLGTVHVRYRLPGTEDYQEHEWTLPYTGPAPALDQADPAMRLAATAAEFSEWLANSADSAGVTTEQLLGYIRGVPEVYGADARPKKLEWMIRQAGAITGR